MAGETWECDHRIALINGGEHREGNLQVICLWCHRAKTRADVAIKSKNYHRRAKHVGAARKRSSFATNKCGMFKKKMNGEVVRR